MRILGIIPARGGSKGIPNKNIKLLGGKPLIQYTSEVALESKLLSRVIVSTDSERIMNLSRKLNLEVPFRRPKSLSDDRTPTLSVVLHAIEFFEKRGIFFDAICLLQVTSPFRSVDFLDSALFKFINNNSDSLISVREVPHEYNPHWVFEELQKGFLSISTGEEKIISRRQDLPKAYYRDGSIYITKTSVIKKQKSLFGKTVSYIIPQNKIYVNIDTVEDWKRAEDFLRR